MAIMRSSVAEFKGHREALETLYIWTGVRLSDKEGVGSCCEDKVKVDAEVQRLVLGDEVQWGVYWRKIVESLKLERGL